MRVRVRVGACARGRVCACARVRVCACARVSSSIILMLLNSSDVCMYCRNLALGFMSSNNKLCVFNRVFEIDKRKTI